MFLVFSLLPGVGRVSLAVVVDCTFTSGDMDVDALIIAM